MTGKRSVSGREHQQEAGREQSMKERDKMEAHCTCMKMVKLIVPVIPYK